MVSIVIFSQAIVFLLFTFLFLKLKVCLAT